MLVGGEDDLMLKIESIIDACNAACSEEAGRKHTGKCLPQHCKRKRLSDAILVLRNPCQASPVKLELNQILLLLRFVIFVSTCQF